ncbi:MAG: CPBP family intramembrane metalloprotease [Defluviitaleaceae bacterium]|nr:CPBP family intramembrane metalloprotease [Defluviitaleaceae bacterium]
MDYTLKEMLKKRPVVYSVALTLVIVAVLFPSAFFRSAFTDSWAQSMIADGVIRLLLGLASMYILGIIIGKSGFKFSFSSKGSKKALAASGVMFIYVFAAMAFAITTLMNTGSIHGLGEFFAVMIPRDFVNGFFEEIIIRGVLMTAALYYFGDTVKGRLIVVFAAAAVFGLLHFTGGLFSIITTFALGIGFAAAYAHSANILVISVLHALINLASGMMQVHRFGVENPLENNLSVFLAIFGVYLVVVVITGVIFTIKAQPFSEQLEKSEVLR